ncbi:MAG: protoporphyrinogen oxidase HemJ [Steroidobacteraceae bacterium]
MLWLKAFHIIFVVTWFAGLFYLPRLFVYHAAASDPPSRERFVVMERRLFALMTLGGALAIAFGVSMVAAAPAYLDFPWLRVKLALVAALVVYHLWCYRLIRDFRDGHDHHSPRWYRIFNEMPGLLLIAIVVLAVVKP